jgi:trimeric autotransporter adhesin
MARKKNIFGVLALVALLCAAHAIAQTTGTGATTVTLLFGPSVPNDTYNPSAEITFTATVISNTGGATPTGTVTFTDETTGDQLPGSPVQLDGTGTAALTISSGLNLGGNNIVASYSGDSTYAANTTQPSVVTLEKSTTTPTVTPATLTPAGGANLAVTVSIAVGTPPAGQSPPTGAVTLNLDGKAAGSAALNTSGGTTSASFTISVPTAGTHSLQAVYAGDDNYDSSTSAAVSITVSKMATTTTLTAAPATLSPGIPEALTAVVNAASGVNSGTAITGSVSFYDGTTLLGTATISSYAATLNNITLSTTTAHLLTAVYSGDTNWAASTSAPLSLAAALLADTITLTAVPTTAGPSQSIAFTATVTPTTTPAATYEQNPTGQVAFFNGTTALGTATLSIGVGNASFATFNTANLPGGSDTITAVYAGDSYFAAGTSNSITVTVQDFTITPTSGASASGLTIIKGQSGSASYVVSGLGGFTGQMQLVCNVPPQANMTCSPSPTQVTPTATVTFTVQTYTTGGPNSTTSKNSRPPDSLKNLRIADSTALAFLVLIAPIGGRARKLRRYAALVLLLIPICLTNIGCSNSNAPGQQSTGTPLGANTITITATSYINQAVVSHSVYLPVNVIPPSQ